MVNFIRSRDGSYFKTLFVASLAPICNRCDVWYGLQIRTSGEIIEMELDNVPQLLDQLEPKERLEILIKLLPYATPKIDASIWERIA